MTYYRSDWVELGFRHPISKTRVGTSVKDSSTNDNNYLLCEMEISDALFRCVATKNVFESSLYRFPMWDLSFEIDNAEPLFRNGILNRLLLEEPSRSVIQNLIHKPPWPQAYLCVKLVKQELFHEIFTSLGFEEVEHRRLFGCKIEQLGGRHEPDNPSHLRFVSLASAPDEKLAAYQKQIIDICREAFTAGFSRHFNDPFLLDRIPGTEYIVAVMGLNFDRLPKEQFLVALDDQTDEICAFTVVGTKPGIQQNIYTQLLSAVRAKSRGQGIYRGLTRLLFKTFPKDAGLLNVTHADNTKIQRAYQNSGREYLADTVVLRRVLYSA